MSEKSKKITKPMKEQLRFLVEEFLEKSVKEIEVKIGGHDNAAKAICERLEGSLFGSIFWMDEPDHENLVDSDYEELLKYYHAILKPIWDQFRDALFDYKQHIIPERAKLQKARVTIDQDTASPLFKYKDLLKQTTALDLEKFHDIKLKESFKADTLTVSFESGRVTFYKRNLDAVNNLTKLLSDINIDHFKKCEHCDKCIFIIRADKRFCPGCAAKKFQKDKWQQDPEGMRKKERVRYRERRKKH